MKSKNGRCLFIALCILFAGACDPGYGTDSTNTDEDCVDGETQCLGDLVQMCDLGAWIDWDDCGLQDLVCSDGACVVQGTADIDSDTDSDSDSDTDSDSDSDSDGDTGTGECEDDIVWPEDSTLNSYDQMEVGKILPNWTWDGYWDPDQDGNTDLVQVTYTNEDLHCTGRRFLLVITGADW